MGGENRERLPGCMITHDLAAALTAIYQEL